MSNKPDPVVREPEARDSVEQITKGLAEDAQRAGILPPMREIEKLAHQVTHETIARHEEHFRRGVPDQDAKPQRQGEGAKLDQGSFSDELGDASLITRPFDKERHRQKTAKTVPLEHAVEAALVSKRLGLLCSTEKGPDGKPRERYPEWAERARKAYAETLSLSKNLGIPHAEAESNAADAVLKVLDESNAAFGDWRHPKAPEDRPLIIIGGM